MAGMSEIAVQGASPAPASGQVFNPRLVFGLVAAGVLAFICLMLLIAYGGALNQGRDGRAHALSVSAIGYKGLVDLVGNFHATRVLRSAEGHDGVDMMVISIEPQMQPEALARMLERRENKTTLIILPKWLTIPENGHPGWVRGIAPGFGEMAARILGRKARVRIAADPARGARIAEGAGVLDGLTMPIPDSPQVIDGDDVTPLVSLPGGGALVAQIGDQPHFVVADPDLLNNHGLKDPAAARAALALIDGLNTNANSGVDFDVTLNGLDNQGGPSLLRLAFEPPFLVMTLALFIAAVLAGLHGAIRFGQARAERRAIALGKSALVENSAGLIKLAGREPRLGGAYAELVRQDAARIAAVPAWVQGEALDAYLDKLSRSDRPSFSDLARRLAAARDRHELVAAARALFSWKKDIIR
jgi:hypothetical protein